MLPNLNPKKMQEIMKQMGMSQEEIQAERVVIEKSDGSKINIDNPSVTKLKIQNQESFQISGDVSENSEELFSEEDIKIVMQRANCSESNAKKALEKTKGDLAEAILELK